MSGWADGRAAGVCGQVGSASTDRRETRANKGRENGKGDEKETGGTAGGEKARKAE